MIDEKKLAELRSRHITHGDKDAYLDMMETLSLALKVVRAARKDMDWTECNCSQECDYHSGVYRELKEALAPFSE